MGFFDDFDFVDIIVAPIAVVGTAIATPYIVATTIYDEFSDSNEYETTSYDNKSEKEAEIREEYTKEKKNKIYTEIEKYKKAQKRRMKDKYDIDIEFYSGTLGYKNAAKVSSSWFGGGIGNIILDSADITKLPEKISITYPKKPDTIAILEEEIEDLIKLIGKMEVEKYEANR